MKRKSRKGKKGGSPTNASEAVDDVKLGPDASDEDVLDEGLQETFPASDPVSVQKTYKGKAKKKP